MTAAFRITLTVSLVVVSVCLLLTRLHADELTEGTAAADRPPGDTPAGMAWIPGGWFTMGDETFPDAVPLHRVYVDGFWMDTHEVTNGEFARFVEATGYVTVAERPIDPAKFPGVPAENLEPGSIVFAACGPRTTRQPPPLVELGEGHELAAS